MSEGFHPKPKLSFPSALALGIAGREEVLELDLVEPVEPEQLQLQLNELAPPGLVVVAVASRGEGQRKARLEAMWYEFPVPQQRRQQVRDAIATMTAASSMPITRADRSQPVDILANLTSIELRDDGVRFCLRASRQASAHPRDVLRALGLADLEQQGLFLTRSGVEVTS
jgi:radical SAM-linked protein